MASEAEAALSELRGFLEAFEHFNNKSNHGYTFILERLPAAETVSHAVELHFSGDAKTIVMTPLEDWPQTVYEVFTKWLFEFQSDFGDSLVDASKSFSLTHESWRKRLLESVMKRLDVAIRPSVAWRVVISETYRFYECAWDDIALEGQDGAYLLHLGVSD